MSSKPIGSVANWRQALCNRVSLRVNRGLNGGDCPGPTALGECAAVYELWKADDDSMARFMAEVFLSARAVTLAASTVAQWVEDAGGSEIVVSQVLHDPGNGTLNSECLDGARHWTITFDGQPITPPAPGR